jgi:hypothetical protein
MRISLGALAAITALTAAPAAFAQPTPAEQLGMHIGTTTTNGSSTIVTDRNGTHPDGFTGMSPINHAMADSSTPPARHRHHRRFHDAEGR